MQRRSGGIPDVIIDRKTGFIIENNYREYLPGVRRGECDPCAELLGSREIAEARRRFLEENFTFESTVV